LRRLVFRRLASLRQGRLTVVDAEGHESFGDSVAGAADLELYVRDARFYRRLAFGGSLGAAEAYFLGYWDSSHLVKLVRLFHRDTAIAAGLEGGIRRLTAASKTIAYRLRNNSLAGSRRNIAAHYDLGDNFFALVLDETMAYSCGIFPHPQSTLREASRAKFARVCHKLQLCEDDEVLEIGSGWGGFALYAAQNHGCRVTTTTISKRQYEFTVRRVEAEGLTKRVTVLCQDYRKLAGRFDKLVSIEMIEAVGHEDLPQYLETCAARLRPDGRAVIQAIIMPDRRYTQYRRSVDFIQRYVFPGSHLPSLGAIQSAMAQRTDFRLQHLEDLTPHYAVTLRQWRERFHENIEAVRALGYPPRFERLWHYYLCYCEAAFAERYIGDVQITLVRAGDRSAPVLPALESPTS
jgi:cyclopropane-fatty-acyl-phospholipid synthase